MIFKRYVVYIAISACSVGAHAGDFCQDFQNNFGEKIEVALDSLPGGGAANASMADLDSAIKGLEDIDMNIKKCSEYYLQKKENREKEVSDFYRLTVLAPSVRNTAKSLSDIKRARESNKENLRNELRMFDFSASFLRKKYGELYPESAKEK